MLIKFQLTLDIDEALIASYNLNKDVLYVSGSSDFLGNWNLNKAIEMKFKTNLGERSCLSTSCSSLSSNSSWDTTIYENCMNTNILVFEAEVEIAEPLKDALEFDAPINYKYFIGQKCLDKTKSRMFLKQIEYTWRKLKLNSTELNHLPSSTPLLIQSSTKKTIEINDKWGVQVDEEGATVQIRTDSGWLLDNENEIQFHFFRSPMQIWSCNLSQKPLDIKIIPFRTNNGLDELKDFAFNRVNFDDKHISEKKTTSNAFNSDEVYASYRIRTFEKPTDLLFQINVHEFDDNGILNEKVIATGYYKVNKTLLENSMVETDISLMTSNQMVGCLKTEILLITSLMESNNYLLTKNYNYHFNRSCIPIGHRGMGKTFDADTLPDTSFVENTIESFREAHNRGAQMVEFDIVLTKDKIPIVYHDFMFCINQEHENNNSDKYLSIAVNQLTYEEIKLYRIYSAKIEKSAKKSNHNRDLFTSKQMFPTLKEMCSQMDSKLGFNVEIKYPIDLEDGDNEVDSHIKWLNRNDYVDAILKELYICCADEQRCVIISTFDPNLCSMIRMKQNKFPVLFLTNGITNKWKPYKDARCKNTQVSLNYAKAECLHGIVAHAEELTKNFHLINILFYHTLKSANFLAFSWGDDLNEIEKRQLFSRSGINGIIYDRISEKNLANMPSSQCIGNNGSVNVLSS